jgi:hypothetical protein
MELWALLTLAKKMGVDPDDMIGKTERAERELEDYLFKYPGFEGELPFDLTITLLGKSVTRKAKVVYEHTPDWEYWDTRKQAPFTGREGTKFHIEAAAVPVTEEAPEWFEMGGIARDGVLPEEIWDAVLNAINDKCKAEDAERRRVAAEKRAAATRTSKKRH